MTAPPPPAIEPAPPANPIAWADPQRAAVFEGWLAGIAAAHRLLPGTVRLASADASFRRYFRVDTAEAATGTRIVMDAPPDKENSEPFVQVARLMAEAGVTAPRVLEWDRPNGFLLLDDLGHRTMLDVIDPAQPDASRPLYDQAIDALIRWQLASKPGVLPPYDRALLERELALFPEWYIGRHRGIAVEGKLKERLERSFKLIVESNLASPSVYVHRDFMPRNLMVNVAPTLGTDVSSLPPEGALAALGRPGGGSTSLGVLDFQDAVYGPVTYDIASLMRDAFLSWDEEFVLDITIRYWEAARRAELPVDADFGAFYRSVEWMGLQRHLKVAGIFARLTLRDGKPRYLADAPRFIAYIRSTASRYMELTPLLRVIDEVEGTSALTGFAYGRV
ncbi:aminoglycoside/choline kinase family phosphotransferase [Variovorax paradoxus]|jgi:N-acetylmuramate 1-kinase|uniref:aminoglycoside phosphotransferase family protein n=1 Tax=Variovorax paradoxus TaxID=34073 RepID=UPI0027922CE5|nr:phosphotransferase [Variovorax paradoxus]MDQ0573272.1 aminoglycoside/choline kinase family phosphotransferase [Variovorax paradoxus]